MTTGAHASRRETPTYTAEPGARPAQGPGAADDAVLVTRPPAARGTLSPTFPPRAPSRRWSREEEVFVRMQQGCQY